MKKFKKYAESDDNQKIKENKKMIVDWKFEKFKIIFNENLKFETKLKTSHLAQLHHS